jgi:hypothetical protein
MTPKLRLTVAALFWLTSAGFAAAQELWPSYNWFYETNERRYYNGAELWNEFRPGYTFDFRVGDTPAFVNVQYLIGFGLYGGNKPQNFKDKASEEPVFTAPMVFVGWRF